MYVKLELSDETKTISDQLKELGYNMYDINDDFYQDICTPYKSSHDSDILLVDRVNYIFHNDDSQCPNNCEFFNYFLGPLYVNCSCSVDNEESTETKQIDELDAKTFFQSFYYVLKYSNYDSFKCYQLVFSKTCVTKNIGSILLIIFFLLDLTCLIIYIIKGITPLKNSIENIIEENKKISFNFFSVSFPPQKMKLALQKMEKKEPIKTLSRTQKKIKAKNSNLQSVDRKDCDSKNSYYSKDIINNDIQNKNNKISKFKKKEKEIELKIEETNGEKKQKEYDDFELNELPYSEILKYDKRSFWKIYLSLIKREHTIIFTFFVHDDYNLFIVKLSNFIFLLATDMAMNVFFFSDSTMHKIFLNYGKFNFIQQIPQIIYSAIVSYLFQLFSQYLCFTDKYIYEIKKLDSSLKNKEKIMTIIRCIKLKLIFYFIFIFAFSGFYWYIIAVFCAVYENTQTIFLLDSFINFLLSNIFPFIVYLFVPAFRICIRKCKKTDNKIPNMN